MIIIWTLLMSLIWLDPSHLIVLFVSISKFLICLILIQDIRLISHPLILIVHLIRIHLDGLQDQTLWSLHRLSLLLLRIYIVVVILHLINRLLLLPLIKDINQIL